MQFLRINMHQICNLFIIKNNLNAPPLPEWLLTFIEKINSPQSCRFGPCLLLVRNCGSLLSLQPARDNAEASFPNVGVV